MSSQKGGVEGGGQWSEHARPEKSLHDSEIAAVQTETERFELAVPGNAWLAFAGN